MDDFTKVVGAAAREFTTLAGDQFASVAAHLWAAARRMLVVPIYVYSTRAVVHLVAVVILAAALTTVIAWCVPRVIRFLVWIWRLVAIAALFFAILVGIAYVLYGWDRTLAPHSV